MDPSEAERDQELASFLADDLPNIDKDELLLRPTTEIVSAFLLSFVKLCPTKSEEKFGEYIKQVLDRFMHICSGDLRTARAQAAFALAKPILSEASFTLSFMDILNPTPARTKAMALECMNFFGFINFIGVDEDSYSDLLLAWEERNAKKAEHEALVQKLVEDIDRAKTAREKARVTINALQAQRQKMTDEVKILYQEKEQVESQQAALKAELAKEKEIEDDLDEEIRKTILNVEGLKDQIVESPEKAAVEISQLTETLHQLKAEINEAEEMHHQMKSNTTLRKGAAQALKKDLEVLQQILQATEHLQKVIQSYQKVQDRLSVTKERIQEAEARKMDAQNRMEEVEAKNRPNSVQILKKIESCREEMMEMEMECKELERRLDEDEVAKSEIIERMQLLGRELEVLSAVPEVFKATYEQTAKEVVDAVNRFAEGLVGGLRS